MPIFQKALAAFLLQANDSGQTWYDKVTMIS